MATAGLVLALAGIICYFLARRGFVVGTHPFCAACRFDLFGLPEGHKRCPECGAEILRDRAVEFGHRRPVFPVMVAGAFVGLAGVGLLGAAAVTWWGTFDGSRFKPVSMLEREMGSGSEKVRSAACWELWRRINKESLSEKQCEALAADILKWQADTTVKWDEQWGDIVQDARHTHRISKATWERYLSQAMQVSVLIRPRVGLNEPLPVVVWCGLKAGYSYTEMIPATLTPEMQVVVDGATQPMMTSARSLLEWPDVAEWNALGTWNIGKATVGAHAVRVTVAMTLRDASGATGTVSKTFDVSYEVLKVGESSVALHKAATPEEEQEFAKSIEWRLQMNMGKGIIPLSARAAIGDLFLSGPPVTAAFRVVLRQGGHEWVVGRFMVHANDGSNNPLRMPAVLGELRPGPAELVCVPEPDLAAGTVDVMEVWGAEVKKDVVISVAVP